MSSSPRLTSLPSAARRCGLEYMVPLLLLAATTLDAQSTSLHKGVRSTQSEAKQCALLCAPTITLMPGVLRNHLARGPIVRSIATGVEQRLPETWSFQIVATVAARTAVPRVNLYGTAQWLPNVSAKRNPFTLYTASDLGDPVLANAPTLGAGASIALLQATETRGWGDLSANIGDLFSQAARPTDRRDYTHKLDLGLIGHVHAFTWAPPGTYAHKTSLYVLLDYVATGLARKGDEVPRGRIFVTNARPLALLVGLALPLTTAER